MPGPIPYANGPETREARRKRLDDEIIEDMKLQRVANGEPPMTEEDEARARNYLRVVHNRVDEERAAKEEKVRDVDVI